MRAQLVRAAVAAVAVAAAATSVGSGGAQAAPAAATDGWEVLQLEPLEAGDITSVFDINETGGMAGGSGDLPVVWTPEGEPFALPIPNGFVGGVAFSLNDRLQAVGLVWTAEDDARAILWNAGATTLLGVNDLVDEISPNGVMLGIDLGGLLDGDDCCLVGFVQAVGGPKYVLPAPPTLDIEPAALTDSGIVIGMASNEDVAIGAGWYRSFVFPIGGIGAELRIPIDVIPAPAVLAAKPEVDGASSVLIDRWGRTIPLAGPSPIDLASDLNGWGVAVGAGGNDFEEGPLVGRIYAFGQAISLDSLVEPADHAGFDLHDPIALNDRFWIVGNSGDGSSWLLRPATGAAAAPRHLEVAPSLPADGELPVHRGEPPSPVGRPLAWAGADGTPLPG